MSSANITELLPLSSECMCHARIVKDSLESGIEALQQQTTLLLDCAEGSLHVAITIIISVPGISHHLCGSLRK